MNVIHLLDAADINNFCRDSLQLTASDSQIFTNRFDSFLPLTVVHESDYYDRDWTSMLAEHYSTIFGRFPRVVDRLHIFGGTLDKTEVIFQVDKYQDCYFGFITIYPCRPRCFGRSLLSADRLNLKPGVLTCENQVHLAGTPLKINAFPFSGQDAKLLSCAHIAIWQVARYFSTKYGYYGEHYQADIARVCENPSFGRSVPTQGLHWSQMLAGLNALRLRPVIYDDSTDLWQMARKYLISGIPVILGGVHSSGQGHAVVGVGLKNPNDIKFDIIVNDDNYLPYGVMSVSPNNCSIKICDLQFVIAPLYTKIVLPIESAEKHAQVIESDQQFGTGAHGLKDICLDRRVFLSSSRTYKKSLCQRSGLGVFEILARTEAFPKFVWIVEYFERAKPDEVVAEYVLDATTSEHDYFSFILLKYQSRVWKNDRTDSQINRVKYYDMPASPPWPAFEGHLWH